MKKVSKQKPELSTFKLLSGSIYKFYFRENLVDKGNTWEYDEYTTVYDVNGQPPSEILSIKQDILLTKAKEQDKLREKKEKINSFKIQLNNSDYQILKAAENFMIGGPPSYEFSKLLSDRISYRDGINEIEGDFDGVNPLDVIKSRKIIEMSAYSQAIIINGIDYNNEHFRLNTTDQINLTTLGSLAAQGKNVPYHADSKVCRIFTAEEMMGLVAAASNHIIYHTTYFNFLKHQILEMTSENEVVNVYYGMELKEEYQEVINTLLGK